jgi:hypothetical protein
MTENDQNNATASDSVKKTAQDARQGERKKGMPSVLVISTLAVIVIFGIMLIVTSS